MSDQDKEYRRQQDEPVAIIMSDGESYDFMVTVEGQKRIPRTGEWVHLYAYPLPAVAVQTGSCAEGDHCNCGGDLPRIREGCANWRNGNAAVAVHDERAAFELFYAKEWRKFSQDAAHHSVEFLCNELKEMRNGSEYGESQDYLNFMWEGWQARAAAQNGE